MSQERVNNNRRNFIKAAAIAGLAPAAVVAGKDPDPYDAAAVRVASIIEDPRTPPALRYMAEQICITFDGHTATPTGPRGDLAAEDLRFWFCHTDTPTTGDEIRRELPAMLREAGGRRASGGFDLDVPRGAGSTPAPAPTPDPYKVAAERLAVLLEDPTTPPVIRDGARDICHTIDAHTAPEVGHETYDYLFDTVEEVEPEAVRLYLPARVREVADWQGNGFDIRRPK